MVAKIAWGSHTVEGQDLLQRAPPSSMQIQEGAQVCNVLNFIILAYKLTLPSLPIVIQKKLPEDSKKDVLVGSTFLCVHLNTAAVGTTNGDLSPGWVFIPSPS